MKPLQIVRVKQNGRLAIIMHVSKGQNGWPDSCHVEYIKGQEIKEGDLSINSWHTKEDIEVVDSLTSIINRSTG